jgi:hypothetical protein
MSNISFFTAIKYTDSYKKSMVESALEQIDNYFYLGGKKLHIIGSEDKQPKGVLSETDSSVPARIAKVFSYFTIVIPLTMLLFKSILRSTHYFTVMDPKIELEKGMKITEKMTDQLTSLMPKIVKGEKDDSLIWISQESNYIFQLKDYKDQVFKLARPSIVNRIERGGDLLCKNEDIDKRFNNMVKAKEICLVNGLNLLIIPPATKQVITFKGMPYHFIIEKHLDFNPDQTAQEELYNKYSTDLKEAVRQLVILIAKIGLDDIVWRNIPVLNEKKDFMGNRRVALIDLEFLGNVQSGVLGGSYCSRGLIRCVNKELITVIMDELLKQKVLIDQAKIDEVIDLRYKELDFDEKLEAFYKDNNITTGREPIKVDLETLELDLKEEGEIASGKYDKDESQTMETITLKEVIETVIGEINKSIKNSSDQASIKGKRFYKLNLEDETFRPYNRLCLKDGESDNFNKELKANLWLDRIIQALSQKGVIHLQNTTTSFEYGIQA